MYAKNPAPTPLQLSAVALLAFGVFFAIWQYIIPHFVTKSRVEDAARIARAQDLKTGYCFKDRLDWWKNPICVKREVYENARGIEYTAISPGRDGQFDTDDDYQNIKVDLNKTRMLGEYLGKRVKRGFEGFVDGVRTPDKFKDEEGTGGTPRKPDKKRSWKFWKHNDNN